MTVNLVKQLDDFRLVFEEFKEKWTDEDIFSLLAKATDRIEILEVTLKGVLTHCEYDHPPNAEALKLFVLTALDGE